MSRLSIWIATGALVATGLIGWQVSWHKQSPARSRLVHRRPELAGLVAAVGVDRPFEPRLTGQFAYGPIPAVSRSSGGVLDLSPDVRIAVAQLEKKAARSRSDSDWAALGVAYLVSGELDKGLEFLEAAVASPVPNPDWLSDLSAAYLLVA